MKRLDLVKALPDYTYEDYRHWEGEWELIEGVPYAVAPSPLSSHQHVIAELIYQIKTQFAQNCQKECYVFTGLDWVIGEDTVVRPDVVVICERVKD